MQEKRQPVFRLPFSYSGPGSSLRGWNACRVGRHDALSPSPDMDRESAYGAETLDRMPSVIPFTIPGCCPDGRGLWHGRLGIEPTTRGFGETVSPPWDIRPYMDRNPTCEVGTPSRIEGVMLFHQFRVSDVRAGICHPA